MRTPSLLVFGALLLCAAAEQVFEDSPALTALWQASHDGNTDAFISQLITNKDYGQHRAADGRGPMFWAYEFKNVDTLALLMHLEVPTDQEDVDGHNPKEFFPDSEALRDEFEADAKAKVEELAALLKEREEEYYAYQNSPDADDEDYDDEAEEEAESSAAPKQPKIDSIDCMRPPPSPSTCLVQTLDRLAAPGSLAHTCARPSPRVVRCRR